MSVLMEPSTWTVLVVDDDNDIRFFVKGLLEMAGVQVIVADSGKACMRSLAQRIPTFVLLDITMPDMSGIVMSRRTNVGILCARLRIQAFPESATMTWTPAISSKPLTKNRMSLSSSTTNTVQVEGSISTDIVLLLVAKLYVAVGDHVKCDLPGG